MTAAAVWRASKWTRAISAVLCVGSSAGPQSGAWLVRGSRTCRRTSRTPGPGTGNKKRRTPRTPPVHAATMDPVRPQVGHSPLKPGAGRDAGLLVHPTPPIQVRVRCRPASNAGRKTKYKANHRSCKRRYERQSRIVSVGRGRASASGNIVNRFYAAYR